ncbi:YceI family protein [Flavobacterium sp.]|uniref:YceI family protein n=1 Tax=Flavobacterium sp. TaxID=239 RepID=UPI003B9BFF75
MRKILFLFAILSTSLSLAQKLTTKTGKLAFEASVPGFEEVKAKNENVTCVLNKENGEIATLALMKAFRFKIALMEEHFNENYVESDTYPKATFKGKITGFNADKLTTSWTEYQIKGKLEMHGKTNDVTAAAKIRKNDGGIEIQTSFNVNASDYAIKIPSVVKSKVSNKIDVTGMFLLK